MSKIKNLFNFLTLGIFLSVVILFIGDLFGFSLGINFHLLFRILVGFLALALVVNVKNIKDILGSSTVLKKFLLLTGINLFLFVLFLLFYPIFRFGSPLIFEDRIPNFKTSQKEEIVLGEALRQNFLAKSNNLGTIGLKIISQDLVVNGDEEVKEELFSEEIDKIVFRIKEEKEEGPNYFYENIYELPEGFQTSYFLFGFPIQYESQDKSYVFEIEKIEQGETDKVFLIEKNSEGKFNFYPRYVYSLKEVKSDYNPILLNISRKTNQFLEEKTSQINLIIVFLLIEILIISFLKKEEKYFKEKINPYLKYGFLIGLFLIALSSLNFDFVEKVFYLKNISSFLLVYNLPLILFTIIFGFLVFYFNKEKIERETEKEKAEEKLAEEKRYQEFGNKFPTINKIPILRSFVRWCYKEGWRYSLGLIAIFVIVAFVFSYRIGSHDFREDEFQVVNTAAGYYYTGNFYQWDWLENKLSNVSYARAWPHTWLIAQSYKLFGISEWSSRIISVLFGIIFIPMLFFISKFFTENKKLALVIASTAIFYPSYIIIFRHTRMYALLIPLFLLLVYLLYRGLTEKGIVKARNRKIYEFLRRNLNYNYFFLALALGFLYLNYLIHINSLVILPAALLFIFIMACVKKEKRYLNLSRIGILFVLGVSAAYYLGFTKHFLNFLSFFGRRNFLYIDFMTQYPFSPMIGLVLLTVGFPFVFFFKSNLKYKILYLYMLVLFSLFFFIFIAERYSGFVYISHITPISIILILFTYLLFLKVFDNKLIRTTLAVILILVVGINFYQNTKKLYADSHSYGVFSKAYKVIINNYNPEKDVIFGQYLRTFYLQELVDKKVKVISMLNNKQYEFEAFMNDLQKYESGYITWGTRKSYHISTDIINYIDRHFKKLHGRHIDDTNVEVYYFDQTMIRW